MNLILKRLEVNEHGCFGEVLSESGQFLFTSLEHAYGDSNWVKIPQGTYTCKRDFRRIKSIPEGFWTFEVMDVPERTGILFHVGNYEKDSDGCILLGLGYGYKPNKSRNMITNSRKAMAKFMELQEGVDEFLLVVQNNV